MLDYASVLLGPIYRLQGAPVTLTIGANSYTALPSGAPLRVLDKTSGIALAGPIEIETTRPVAMLRASDLAALSIDPDTLDGGTLNLNGKNWQITSHRAVPTPDGYSGGEVYAILEGEF
jgi:hypothetical protein